MSPASRPRPPAPGRVPAVVVTLVAAAGLLLTAFLLTLRPGPDTPADLPVLRILAPREGDTLPPQPVIHFTTPARLVLDPTKGWVAGGLHLHLILDGLEVMPAAADIVPAEAGSWYWHLRPLSPGRHRVHLTWADASHRNLPLSTDTILFHVRAAAGQPGPPPRQ